MVMRRSVVLLAMGALGLGACSAAGSGSYSGAVVDGGVALGARGVAQASASAPVTSMAPESQAAGSPAASMAPGASTGPLPSALIPGITLTVEPADGSIFGLPSAVPSGTNLLLFNVADVPYQMTVLEKNPSVTDSWDVILACGVTSDVATVVGSVIADPGAGSSGPVTVVNQGDHLLVMVPLAAPAESAAPSEAPSVAPSEVPSAVPSEVPSAAASDAASPAATVAPEPTATPAPTCPPGGIAGASPAASMAAESAAPSIAVASAAPSQAASSTKPHKTPKPGKAPKPGKSPKPTATPAPTPIPGIPDLTNAAWQVFTVTPPGTLPGQTAAP
jgi:hypothetical protein